VGAAGISGYEKKTMMTISTKSKNPTPSRHEYESYEIRKFLSEMQEVEKAPLSDRKESAAEWLQALKSHPKLIADRINWLLNGSYGFGSYKKSREIARNTRINRVSALAQMVAALEWRVPSAMARAAWNKLTTAEQQRVNKLILAEISEWLSDPEHATDNLQALRGVVMSNRNPITHTAWNVYLHGKKIDTIFYSTKETADSVKRSLVDHDGYDSGIVVRKNRKLSDTGKGRVSSNPLLKGDKLNSSQRQQVLSAFGYRWTKENETRARSWYKSSGFHPPMTALQTDDQWLKEHAFHFTKDGSRLAGNRKYAEPSFMAEDNPGNKKSRKAKSSGSKLKLKKLIVPAIIVGAAVYLIKKNQQPQ
jgi:hypothetical protein